MLELHRQIVTLTSWNARSEKHGDERVPAGDLKLRVKASNTMLDQIDPALRRMFYRATNAKVREAQGTIPGTEATDTPAKATNRVDDVDILYEVPGYVLRVYHGIGDDPYIALHDVTIDKVAATLFEGGTVEIEFRARATVDAEQSGALHMLLQSDIDIDLIPPEHEPSMMDEDEKAEAA